MGLSRRQFLTRVGAAGGYSAAFTMMQSLGMMPIANSVAETPVKVDGKGTKVVILGGGIAGLVSATSCASSATIARCSKPGDALADATGRFAEAPEVEFTDGTKQSCQFDEGHYFNAGPARLPSIHKNIPRLLPPAACAARGRSEHIAQRADAGRHAQWRQRSGTA